MRPSRAYSLAMGFLVTHFPAIHFSATGFFAMGFLVTHFPAMRPSAIGFSAIQPPIGARLTARQDEIARQAPTRLAENAFIGRPIG